MEKIRKKLEELKKEVYYAKHADLNIIDKIDKKVKELDKLVNSSNVIHDVSDSFQFTHEEIESMTNRELIIYCEYLKLKQYPLFWRHVDEVKIEK